MMSYCRECDVEFTERGLSPRVLCIDEAVKTSKGLLCETCASECRCDIHEDYCDDPDGCREEAVTAWLSENVLDVLVASYMESTSHNPDDIGPVEAIIDNWF